VIVSKMKFLGKSEERLKGGDFYGDQRSCSGFQGNC
jgi:hypothetical protein